MKVNAVILENQRNSLVPPRFNTNTQKNEKNNSYIYTNIYMGDTIKIARSRGNEQAH